MSSGRRGRLVALATMLVALALTAPSAHAEEFAPLDRPGPALSVPESELRAALTCTPTVDGANRPPVVLVPGTTLDPETNFDWNYERALTALGFPYCTIALDDNGLADIQGSAEHVVFAIREAARRSGRKVQVIGYSQGGMVPRWALRFFPDTRALVEDVVGLAPSNHGTLDADGSCAQQPCAPAVWQQRTQAAFIAALDSGRETHPGIPYTVAYSRFDQIVTPNQDETGSSSLEGPGDVSNIRLQDVCPTNTADHLALGTYDPVGYAIALDAITHPGPAQAERIDRAVCAQPFQPGVDPATFPREYARFTTTIAERLANYPRTAQEPALRCFVFAAGCGPTGAAPASTAPTVGTTSPPAARACVSRRRFTIHVRPGRRALRLRRVTVNVDGRRVAVRRRGRQSTATVDLRGRPGQTVRVLVRAFDQRGRRYSDTRRYRTCRVGRGGRPVQGAAGTAMTLGR